MTSPVVPSPPSGWYADAVAPGVLRWYDGRQWTEHTRQAPPDEMHWVVPIGRRGSAILAGYVALFAAFIWVLAPVSLGLGWWALRDVRRNGGHGTGRAWFAIAVGALGMLGLLLFVVAGVTAALT